MPIIIPPAGGVAAKESHILDGLNLADGVILELADTPVFTPAPLRLDWVGGIDTDGTIPVDAGRSDNSTLLLPLRVKPQATADLAWNKLGLVVAKLEAARRSRTGLTHSWKPKDATDTWELTVRSGEITEFPMNDRDSMMGYLRRFPRITIMLQCDPFLYRQGELVNFTEVTSTEPVFSITLANVPGHVDAEATVTVTDNATQTRRHVEGGIGENSAAPLLIDSAALVTTGFAGGANTRTGAYSANGVVRATIQLQTQAVCGTGNLTHIGVHRAKARIWAGDASIRLRLAYRTGDGAYSYTPWVAPHVTQEFCEVSFGVITIRKVTAGAQQWDGRIEAYTPLPAPFLEIDYLEVLPAERHWLLRLPYVRQAGLLKVWDTFSGFPTGTPLNSKVSDNGTDVWATSGAATDFTLADGPGFNPNGTVAKTMSRSTVSEGTGRSAQLGIVSYTNIEWGMRFRHDVAAVASSSLWARWVSDTNRVFLDVYPVGADTRRLSLGVVVAGAGVANAYAPFGMADLAVGTWYRMRLVVFASGLAVGTLMTDDEQEIVTLYAQHSAIATGGSLATGKLVFNESNATATASTRYYDDIYGMTPPAEPVAMHPGRAIAIRHDSCERESSDGLTYATLNPRGGRVYVPAAGSESRVTRLWAKARRNDIEVAADDQIADSTKLKVSVRPRYRMPTNP